MQEIELRTEIERGLIWARDLRITTPDERTNAILAIRAIRYKADKWRNAVEETVKAAHAAWKAAVSHRDSILKPLEKLEAVVKDAVARYDEEQERKRKEEEAKLKAQLEEEKRKLEEKLQSAKRADTRAAIAAKLETLESVIVSVPARIEKTEGEYMVEVWRWEIVDAAAIPREYLVPDEKRIAGVVRVMKGETRIPGVKVWSEKETRIRG